MPLGFDLDKVKTHCEREDWPFGRHCVSITGRRHHGMGHEISILQGFPSEPNTRNYSILYAV